MNCTVMGHIGNGTPQIAMERGQFYEVSCEGRDKGRTIVGWTSEPDGGALVRLVNSHPTWADPQVRDIREGA